MIIAIMLTISLERESSISSKDPFFDWWHFFFHRYIANTPHKIPRKKHPAATKYGEALACFENFVIAGGTVVAFMSFRISESLDEISKLSSSSESSVIIKRNSSINVIFHTLFLEYAKAIRQPRSLLFGLIFLKPQKWKKRMHVIVVRININQFICYVWG